ncbi:formate hydrogenlyase subunit E [Escherichia coli]|nr:formate hydrogenlyase subunit E [Escherichia coli]
MSEEKLGQHYLAALNEAFPGVVLDHAWQTKDQLTVTVKVNYLPEVVEFLYYKQGGWLSVLFGNDERKLNGHYAVYYVLSMEKGTKCWVTVRVEVDANKPEYPSVTPRVPAAVWGEREVRDMYGLIPVGLPDERRLVLPDDWPDELYPLRKDSMDYRQRPAPTTDAETYEFINELGDKKKQRRADWSVARHFRRTGSLPSVRRWRKYYRRRLPPVLRPSRHGKTGGNPYGVQRSDLPL